MAVELSEPGSFLALLSGPDRVALAELGGRRRFAPGQHLMHQGEPGDRVQVLLRGHVKATFVESDGKEIVLSFRGPGDVLGELSFASSEPRSSNVVAIEPVEARALSASEFRSFLLRTPSVALALIDVIGRRFRDANRARIRFGASDTLGRVASRLVELCERYGEPADGGVAIRLPLTQEDLAGWTDSSRAAVADALRTMRGFGWIQTARRRIVVLDLDAVRARAG